MNTLFLSLLVLMQFKHFIADYPLQTPYMLGKFKADGWIKPLAAHCAVQAGFTFVIALAALFFTPGGLAIAVGLAALDFTIHFVMDRIKASPNMLGKFKALSADQFKGLTEGRQLAVSAIRHFTDGSPKSDLAQNEARRSLVEIDKKFKGNTYFWWSLGFDQMVHHLTDLFVVYLIVSVK